MTVSLSRRRRSQEAEVSNGGLPRNMRKKRKKEGHSDTSFALFASFAFFAYREQTAVTLWDVSPDRWAKEKIAIGGRESDFDNRRIGSKGRRCSISAYVSTGHV